MSIHADCVNTEYYYVFTIHYVYNSLNHDIQNFRYINNDNY